MGDSREPFSYRYVTKKIMVYKWKEAHTPLFLKHYQSLQCLWDSDCVENKNQMKRKLAIATLAAILRDRHNLNIQESDVRLKIKTIRTRYAAEVTKIMQAKSRGKQYVPKLFWFKQADAFLRPHFKPKSLEPRNCYIKVSDKKRSIPIKDNTTISQTDQNYLTKESLIGKIVKRETEIAQDNNEISFEEDNLNNTYEDGNLETEITETNIPEEYYEEDTETTTQDHLYGQYMENTNENEDEFSLFCRSLAVQLRKMPLARALVCQQKLQDVMVQERLSALKEDSSGRNSSAESQGTTAIAGQQLSYADDNLTLDNDDPITLLYVKAEH